MTTLFPVNQAKLASFLDSLDTVLNNDTNTKATKYGFNFNSETPISNTQSEQEVVSDFKWTLLADEDPNLVL